MTPEAPSPETSVVVMLPASAADQDAYALLVKELAGDAASSLEAVASVVTGAATAPSFPRAEHAPLLLLLADNVGPSARPGGRADYIWLDDDPRGSDQLAITMPRQRLEAFETRQTLITRRWLIRHPIAFDVFVWLSLRLAALAIRLDPELPARFPAGTVAVQRSEPGNCARRS